MSALSFYRKYLEQATKDFEATKLWRQITKRGLFKGCGNILQYKKDVFNGEDPKTDCDYSCNEVAELQFDNMGIMFTNNGDRCVTTVNGYSSHESCQSDTKSMKKVVKILKKVTGYQGWDANLVDNVAFAILVCDESMEYVWYDNTEEDQSTDDLYLFQTRSSARFLASKNELHRDYHCE